MKELIFLLICTFLIAIHAAPTETDPYAADMRNRKLMALECIEKVKIDRKIIEKAIENPNDLPTDAKYKKYLACSYKKQKFLSENGEMLYDNVYNFLKRFYKRSDLNALDTCKSITAQTEGELAYESLKCIVNGLNGIEKVNRA